jgi:hypothetical protein
MQELISFPFLQGIGPFFKMPFTVRVMGHKIMHFQRTIPGEAFYRPFQRIRPAGGWAVFIHRTPVLAKKGAGIILGINHIEHYSGKIGMGSFGYPGMPVHKFRRMQAKTILQPEDIIWIKIHLYFMTTGKIATHLGMTVKMEGFLSNHGSPLGNRDGVTIRFHHFLHKKRLADDLHRTSL